MITARLVVCLGFSQLVAWGTMHYLIAIFGAAIGRDLGLGGAQVQAGFSLALVVMGASSGLVGRWINHHGGRAAMMAGCWIGAAGCVLLATSSSLPQYYASWVLLGLGMRLALYDAAFASLAYLGGQSSKRAMSQITLFGGLASTAFWPIGQLLLQTFGWRGALWAYAAFLVLASGLHLAIPRGRLATGNPAISAAALPPDSLEPATAEKMLYGVIASIAMFMQTGLAAHFIELIKGLGWNATTAVSIATLLGLGQFTARGWVVAWGHRYNPVWLNLLPSVFLCGSFLVSLWFGSTLAGAGAFAFFYGAGNGIATITRGSMPLLLFDAASYGRIVGAILKPAFLLAAVAPIAIALAIERWGQRGTIAAALAMSVALLVASVVLLALYRSRTAPR